MGKNAQTRPALTWATLLAIARRVVRTQPDLELADLNEAIKTRIAREGYAYPPPHQLTEVLRLVGAANAAEPSGRGPAASPTPPSDGGGLSHVEACQALAQVQQRLGPLPALKPRVMPSKPDLLTTRQRYAIVHAVEDARARRDEQRAARRDVQRDGSATAEGQHEGIRAEGMDEAHRDE